MSIAQPASSDFLNSPDHSLLHRIIAADVAAPVESIAVDSTGKTTLNAIAATTVNGLALSLGTNSISTNVAVGSGALAGANSGVGHNVAVGNSALAANTSGVNNVAIGTSALTGSNGNSNIAVGYTSLVSNTSGCSNVGIGNDALYSNSTGWNNTAIGNVTGVLALGSGNVFIGANAGGYETGSNAFYLDDKDEINTAGDKAGALLYGTFNATPASQTLVINAGVTISTLAGTGSRAVLASSAGLLSAPVSDERLKTNITPINSQTVMDMLKDPKIQAINYTWKDESKGSDVELGLTYQMLEPHYIKGLTFYDNEVGGINYDRLCVILWEQNKELLRRIEKLEQK